MLFKEQTGKRCWKLALSSGDESHTVATLNMICMLVGKNERRTQMQSWECNIPDRTKCDDALTFGKQMIEFRASSHVT